MRIGLLFLFVTFFWRNICVAEISPQAKNNIAVSDLAAQGVDPSTASVISDRLRSELFRTGVVTVLERSQMQEILKEQGFQQAGCTTDQCAIATGQLLGVKYMVVGSIGLVGHTYTIAGRLIDVSTGKMVATANVDCKCEIDDVLSKSTSELSHQLVQSFSTAQNNRSSNASPIIIPVSGNKSQMQDEMILVPGGTFLMGGKEDSDEQPIHKVTLDTFWLDKYEVTQREFETTMKLKPPSQLECPKCPAQNITWSEADEFCKKKGKRLPSEAEWEYAARAGNKSQYYWGDGDPNEYAWYKKNSNRKVHAVGQKKPNGFGLFDMAGNVREWCNDIYEDKYYSKSPSMNPEGPKDFPGSNADFVQRGGSFFESAEYLRSARRTARNLHDRCSYVGFRCAKDK